MDNNIKEGVSVKEIQDFTKRHRLEVFFALAFLLSLIFGYVIFAGFTIAFCGLGGILGVIFPGRVEILFKKLFHFMFKQEKTIQLVLGVLLLVLSIFLPFVTFFILGLHGGKGIDHMAKMMRQSNDL